MKLEIKPITPSMAKTVLCFTIFFFILHILIATIISMGDIVWTDFIHYNPNRTQSQAIQVLTLSPSYGVVYALICSELSIIIACFVAMISRLVFKRISFFSVIVMIPFCSLALYIQSNIIFAMELEFYTIRNILLIQIPTIISCWWCCNHTISLTSN